jgi:hypothetical protein
MMTGVANADAPAAPPGDDFLDRHVDPVAQAAEYQDLLVGLVGARDPAEVQADQPDRVDALLMEAGESLRIRPEPGEWSLLECVGHLVDAEMVYAGRYRWTLSHDEPPMIGYDQDLWVSRLRHNEDDPRDLAMVFRVLRRANIQLWRRTTAEEKTRVGMHAERGPESFDLSFRLIAGHGIFHLAQARRTLAAIRDAPG